jgi:hypothetical protein
MTRLAVRAVVCAGCLAGLLGLAGCDRGPAFAEVSGTLKVDGKPLENVQVEFWPLASGPRSIGVTDKEGKFTLTSDDGKRTGAVVGPHKVVLIDLAAYADVPLTRSREVENLNLKSSRIPARFSDPNNTPLKQEIVSGQVNTVTLEANP